MAHTDLVRPSRDGDQFHYLWAARRSLMLLRPNGPVAISIEGVTPAELKEIEDGIDAIDVAEYYGSEDPHCASRVRYIQLKHSSRQTEQAWTVSGLNKTLGDFGRRFRALTAKYGLNDVAKRFSFEFVTNRPVAESLREQVEAAVVKNPNAESTNFAQACDLKGEELLTFVNILKLESRIEGYLGQRSLLTSDLSIYLPDRDLGAPIQLKELVTRKATTEFEKNPVIRTPDVLDALRVRPDELYPANAQFELPDRIVDRKPTKPIIENIICASSPIIIQADGGVGKTVFATTIAKHLPKFSEAFVYDCFGNGSYRTISSLRHRPQHGFVQLANEMARNMLCDPLIPSTSADASAYTKAFLARVNQASTAITQRSPSAILCLIIDAADNAEQVASEINDGPSFAKILLRESLPENVRLVITSRSHRVQLLDPQPNALKIDLPSFTVEETTEYLRSHHSQASKNDVQEFHRLTSANPRVQANALAVAIELHEVLLALGPNPVSVQDTIARLLDQAITNLRDQAPKVEKPQIDRLCAALATLRPFVPLDIIAQVAAVPSSLIASFASDLGRAILVRDGAVQFQDEPTETWFQEFFKPNSDKIGGFIDRLQPLAETSPYVAATLPQMLLEAGRFDELVRLTLFDEGLPKDDPIARRDVATQRLQFALQAALRSDQLPQAAKLALKGGGEAAAQERQRSLLGQNTDLGAHFLESQQLLEQVSRRQIVGGSWTGSEYAYESAFLSGCPALAGDAASRLRTANDWLQHYFRSDKEDRIYNDKLQRADIAEFAFAIFNTSGAKACNRYLKSWKPKDIAFECGRIVIARLIDAGRFADVELLTDAAGFNIGILLAAALELDRVDHTLTAMPLKRTIGMLLRSEIHIKSTQTFGDYQRQADGLNAIAATVAMAATRKSASRRELARLLGRYLRKDPPRSIAPSHGDHWGERYAHMRAYALRAALRSADLPIMQLAPKEIKKALKKGGYSPDADSFRRDIGELLPWHQLWADVIVGRVSNEKLISHLFEISAATLKTNGFSYRERSHTADEIASIWGRLLLRLPTDKQDWEAFDKWRNARERSLALSTLCKLGHMAARLPGQQAIAFRFVQEAFEIAKTGRDHAETNVNFSIELSRAILPVNKAEAKAYFEHAVASAGEIGDENLERWEAMLQLASASGQRGCDEPELAYRFARTAELTYHFVHRDKHFDWEHTVEALADLSPRSCLAILSRWQDRHFGRETRVLPEAISRLLEREHIDDKLALALYPLASLENAHEILRKAVSKETEQAQRQKICNWLVGYSRFAESDVGRLRAVKAICEENSSNSVDVSSAIIRAEGYKERQNRREAGSHSLDSKPEYNWEPIFEGLNLTEATGIAEAYARYRKGERPYYNEEFYAEAAKRVSIGMESQFIDAVSGSRTLDLLDTRSILESLPKDWQKRLSVKPAVARLINLACQNCPSGVSAARYNQRLPWKLAEEWSGLTEADIMRQATNVMARTIVPTSSAGLFNLVGVLGQLISQDHAKDVLNYAIDLIDSALKTSDADGLWRDELKPPFTVTESVAGYVWAAMASPIAARRWKAAHVIRGLCTLQQKEALSAVVALEENKKRTCFIDSSLRVYDLHATLWLLIAFARAAISDGDMLLPHMGYLKSFAVREQPHVLMREFSSIALLTLHEKEFLILDDAEIQAYQQINISKLAAAPTGLKKNRSSEIKPYDEKRYSFGVDFGPHWLKPLGELFGLSQDETEELAESVIRQDWGLSDKGWWIDDGRAERKYFGQETWHSHGSSPRVDDLDFYLCFHAMFVVAGKLLETRPVIADKDAWYTFEGWLNRHGLSRYDGLWLADRRDYTPADLLLLPQMNDAEWPSSANSELPRSFLQLDGDQLALAGSWTQHDGSHHQTVSIRSALVTQERSESLVSALCTSKNRMDFKVPDFDDHLEIDERGFQFKGWIVYGEQDRRLDEYDPWAASVASNPLVPAPPVITSLDLHSKNASRIWEDAHANEVLFSQVWSEGSDDNDKAFGDGRRLIAKAKFTDALMAHYQMHVLLEVTVEREVYNSYQRDWKKRNAQKATEIILLRPGQAPWHIRPSAGSRRGTGSRARPRK
jgi:hypothetical protein